MHTITLPPGTSELEVLENAAFRHTTQLYDKLVAALNVHAEYLQRMEYASYAHSKFFSPTRDIVRGMVMELHRVIDYISSHDLTQLAECHKFTDFCAENCSRLTLAITAAAPLMRISVGDIQFITKW